MTTETAPPPAAPAAVPVVPAPVAEPRISSLTKKPISEAAHSLFKMLEESQTPDPNEPDVDEKPTPQPEKVAAAELAKPDPVEPEKPVKVAKKAPKRPDLPIQKEEPAAAPASAPAPTAAPESDWEESLMDEEKAALEDARFAEKVNPKHKGLADKMGKFLREQKKFLEANPGAEEDDSAYKAILATRPNLTTSDKREIAEARVEERVSKKYEPRLNDLQHEIYVRDEEPKVDAEAAQIRQYLAHNALPKDMLTVFKEKGLPVLQKEYADELEIAGGLINTVVDDAKELLRITRINPKTQRSLGEVAADPSHPKWQQHERIAKMVSEVCTDFQKHAPQDEQVRNGKWFVTREEWGKLPANARGQFWTFTNSQEHVREMINRALGWVPDAVTERLKARQDELKAKGYVRQRAEPTPAPAATPPVASSSPATPRPSPSPAPSTTPAGQLTPGQLLARRLSGE